MFGTPLFQLSCSLFTDERRTAPVQDTAQRRHRRRRAVGTRSKVSFQIKTLRKPFLLSLVVTHPLVLLSNMTKEEAGVLACGHVRILARTWTLGAYTSERYLARSHKDRIP